MAITLIQKTGLLTVLFIILTESIMLSNAVQFWSTYQKWSNKYGRGRFASQTNMPTNNSKYNDKFCTKSSSNQQCTSDITSSSSSSSKASIAPAKSKLHPRQNAKMSSRTCSTAMYNCCKESSPSCIHLDVRGGSIEAVTETITATTTTAAAAAAAAVTSPTPYDLPLNLWKVIFQIFLTALNVACWLIPLRAKKISENKLALSIANAFSGGVFLSLAFGHLIPECVHGFEGMNEALPYMIVLGGYLLIFFVEKVAFDTGEFMEVVEEQEEKKNRDGKQVKGEDEEGNGGTNVGRSAVILLGALAVHSILEMTALGLANSFGDSALLTLSIALHQPAESIALLVAFLKSGMPKPDIIKFLSVFSACGPIGVAIGMAVNEFAAPIIDSIMLATVAGTFIYVGATEVIPEEWEEQENKWTKFFALISGIVSIFAITQYTMTLEGQ